LAGNKPAGNSPSSNRASRAGGVTFCKSRKAFSRLSMAHNRRKSIILKRAVGTTKQNELALANSDGSTKPLVVQKFALSFAGIHD